MGRHTKEGYSEKALAALMGGQYDELTGRSAANNWRPSKVPSLVMPKNTVPTSVPKSVPTQKKKNGNLKDRGFGSLYEFENYKTQNMMAETEKNLQLANELMEAASKISQVANPVDKGFPNSINDAFKAPEKKELPSLFEKAQDKKPKANPTNPYNIFKKTETKTPTKEEVDKALVGRVGKDQLNFSDIKRQDNEESQKKKAQDQAAKELIMNLDFQREVADNPLVNPNVDPIKQFTDENNKQAELPKYDKKYEKDFEEFFDYRYDKSDVRDYDPETDRDVEHWRNLKKDIMKKYGWTEDEFNKKYGEYDNYRFAKMDAEEMSFAKALSEQHPIAGSALSVLLAPQVAGEGVETAVHGLIGDEAFNKIPSLLGSDNYAQYRDNNHIATKEKNEIRQTVKDNIDSGVGKFAYDIGMGAVDLGTNMALGLGTPVGMGIVSGAQNAAMNEQSALERGVEPEKAARTGLATGVISGIMNTVGLDAVLKGTAKTVAGSILKAAGTEGLENVVEDIADRWLDNVINRENSEKNQEILYYMQNGMSEEEAYRQSFMNFINQELVSAGQGALFGGVLKGGRMAVGLDSVPSLETENIISDATRQANDARNNIEALAQQIPETPQEVPTVLSDAEKADIQSELAEELGWDIPKAEMNAEQNAPVGESAPIEVDPENVIYHSGTLSRLNKSETRGKMHEGSRNTGYFGTGHYFVDNAHRGEIDNNSNYNGKPYTSVDISKYGNLYKADTDAKAEKLHGFSEDYTRYVNTHNDSKYYTDADGHIDEEARAEYLDDLYKTFRELFPEQPTTKEQFINQINAFRESEYDVDLLDMDDSVFTQLMKSMGYNGVDTTGTRFADTRYGTVIYDLDEDSILQSNVTDDEVKKGLMNTRVRNEGQSVFDTAEDEKIQKSLDSVARKRAIDEEYRRNFDETAFRQLQAELKETETYLERNKESLEEYTKALADENDPAFKEAIDRHYQIQKEIGVDLGQTEEEARQFVRRNLEEKVADVQERIAQREQNVRELRASVDEMEKASKAAYAQAKAKVDGISEADIDTAVADSVAEEMAGESASANQVPEVVNQETQPVNQPVNEVPTVVNQTQPVPTQEVPNVGSDVGNAPPTDVGNPENGGNSPHTKTSEAYTNTGRRGKGWTAQEYKDHTDASQFQYMDVDEEESINRAATMLQNEGLDGFRDRVMDKERLSGAEIDGLMMEWRIIGQQARELEATGEDATDAWNESVRIFRKIQEQSTSNAQALQALAKWSRNTPEGMLAEAENIINGKQRAKDPNKSGLQKEFDKFAKKNKKFKFSDEFAVEFQKKAKDLEGLDPESFEARLKMAELGRMVNRQLPSTLGEKAMTFLMDNMLGNFRTLITRNAGGNVGLNVVEQLAQRPLAALIDMGVSKKTGRRTQAGLSGKGLAEYVDGFTKGLIEERIDYANNLHTARSGENTLGKAIENNRHVFKENGILDKIDKLVRHGLSIGDRPFYEAVYNQTLGDYQRLRERGQMGDVIQNLSDEDFDMYAKTAAKMNALSAVYQQDSKMARALLSFKGAIGDLSRGVVGVDILSQFSMPFVKTPANVVERAIDYSPLGLVRNAFRTGKEIRNDNFDQNRFANETARNILGTALMGGGAAFANAGGMEGAYSKDKDEKKAQKDAGMIEYGLNLPNGYQTDIGWVPVVGSNLVASAAAMDAYNKGEGNAASNLATGLLAGGKAQLDQSMFQGMQRLFGGSGSYDSDKNLFSNMTDVLSSGLGQFVPSLLRQTGQVSDEYQRDLSNSNPDASLLFMDNYDINSLANTLPILRNNVLAPKVGTNGELLEENQGRNVGMKILEDMILPGKISKVEYSALNEEANRLKEATTSADAYMPSANRTLVDTDEHKLTNQEWVDYEQKYYKEMTDIGTQVMKTAFYKNADDMEKTQMLKQAYEGIKYGVNHEYNGKEVSGASKAYVEAGGGENGVKAVLDYVEKGADIKRLENQYGVEINRSDYDKQQKEYPGGAAGHARDAAAGKQYNMSANEYRKAEDEYNGGAAQKAKDVETAKNYGFVNNDGTTNLDAYNKAVELVGNDEKSLKAYSDYKKLGYTKQAQIIPYLLNNSDFDSDQKGRILSGNNVDSLPKGQRGAYDLDNRWTDVYYYNLIRYLADQSGNKNGDTSQKEMQSYISGNDAYVQMLSDNMLNYLKGYK